jgi:hypothetical protein
LNNTSVALSSPPVITSHERLKRAQASIRVKNFSSARIELGFIPADAPEYAEAGRLLPDIRKGVVAEEREQKKRERERIPQLRDGLRQEYEQLLADANPHMNFIGSKITKIKGGYALWATHEYFSQYTFALGDDAKFVQRWITDNEARLREAEIVRVGVMGRGSYASRNYFDLR